LLRQYEQIGSEALKDKKRGPDKQPVRTRQAINGIKPQSKLWTLFSAASCGELNHTFSSAGAEREGGLNQIIRFRFLDPFASAAVIAQKL
jgi:hypothetical protein